MTAVVRISDYRRRLPYLHFTRSELNRLLGLYSARVIRGEWRDYAIVHGPHTASFMIFSRTHDYPQYVISKLDMKNQPRGRTSRNGGYVVSTRQCQLSEGQSLDEVLRVFDRPLQLVTG